MAIETQAGRLLHRALAGDAKTTELLCNASAAGGTDYLVSAKARLIEGSASVRISTARVATPAPRLARRPRRVRRRSAGDGTPARAGHMRAVAD